MKVININNSILPRGRYPFPNSWFPLADSRQPATISNVYLNCTVNHRPLRRRYISTIYPSALMQLNRPRHVRFTLSQSKN